MSINELVKTQIKYSQQDWINLNIISIPYNLFDGEVCPIVQERANVDFVIGGKDCKKCPLNKSEDNKTLLCFELSNFLLTHIQKKKYESNR
jgi:hypothetical protein